MSSFDAPVTTPKDGYEDKRLADVHPQEWVNPKPVDRYALIIIGAGSAGVAAAELAIAMGVKVAMIERHLIGGTFDRISEHPVRHKLYNCVSCLNGNHKKWAWASLCSVGFADIYVRLCSMGIWHDWRIL